MIDTFLNNININNHPNIDTLKSKKVAIFGAGLDGQLAFQYLNKLGITPINYYDNDINKHNTMLDNINVLSPIKIDIPKDIIVFIAVKSHALSIQKQLNVLNIENYIFSDFATTLGIKNRKDDYLKTFNMLTDSKSQELYKVLIKARISGNESLLKEFTECNEFYCLPEFQHMANEIFVDAGAYVGDTLEKFIWASTGRFQKAYAFEPGKKQFNAMIHRKQRLLNEWALNDSQIECINAGLGEKEQSLPLIECENSALTSSFTFSNIDNSDSLINIHSIDSFFKGNKITLLKSDIEGFEMDLLKGARKTIREHKPKLAISIYHKYDDLIDIPLYIHSLVPEYKMALRHHSTNLSETVLYCWIEPSLK